MTKRPEDMSDTELFGALAEAANRVAWVSAQLALTVTPIRERTL